MGEQPHDSDSQLDLEHCREGSIEGEEIGLDQVLGRRLVIEFEATALAGLRSEF